MAREIELLLDNNLSSFAFKKILRNDLYGFKKRIPLGNDGQPCVRAQIDEDTGQLIPSGGLEGVYINQNFTNINLYTDDLRHPSKEGTYLAALMIFTSLSNKTPVGNSYIMGLDPDVAKILQEVSWLTHKSFQKRIVNSGL